MPERLFHRQGKPREHNLGLKPQFLDVGKDLGLTRADIEAASRVWGTIIQVTGRHVELVGLFKDELEMQLGFAIRREEHGGHVVEEEAVKDKSRRRLLGTVMGIGITLLAGGSALAIATDYYSPEKVAARAREARERKEKFEREQVLTTSPSAVSVAGWRVRYPGFGQDAEFLPSDGEDKKVDVISDGSAVKFSKPGMLGVKEDVNTNVAIAEYVRLGGVAVPKLRVKISGTSGSTSSYDTFEEWFLTAGRNVVIFENVNNGEIRYLSIKRTQSTVPAFQVEVMKKAIR